MNTANHCANREASPLLSPGQNVTATHKAPETRTRPLMASWTPVRLLQGAAAPSAPQNGTQSPRGVIPSGVGGLLGLYSPSVKASGASGKHTVHRTGPRASTASFSESPDSSGFQTNFVIDPRRLQVPQCIVEWM